MGAARHLAPAVRTGGRCRQRARGARDRRHPHQGPSLCRRRKKGETTEAIGRSRGGRTSKVHALADACGRPVAFILTPGNTADNVVAPALLALVKPSRRLLGDKAYDTDAIRQALAQHDIEAVIPSSARRTRPYPLDRHAYKRRNRIERMFCRLKDWRRIATRYDRRADNFLAAIALVATVSFWY
jgi:transposase